MKKNVGTIDKILRIILAAVFVVLYATGVTKGAAGIVLLIVALALIFSVITGFCFLYKVFGINTCPVQTNKDQKS